MLRRSTGLRAAAVAAAALLALALAGTAWGHAVLVRSDPAQGARLAAPPRQITLWFTEPLERSFSTAELYAPDGSRVDGVTVRFPDGDPAAMTLEVGVLSPGVYTVAWQTLSRVDGHEWRGNFTFTVLNPDGTEPAGGAAPLDLGSGGTELPSWGAVLARWLSLGGAVLLAGSLAFAVLVALPAAEPLAAEPARRARAALAVRTAELGLLAVAAAWVGGAVQALLDLDRLGGLEVAGRYLMETRPGLLWLLRQGLLLAAVLPLALAWSARARPAALRRWLLAGLAVAGGVLLTFSLLGHPAAGAGRAWTVATDFIHLAAAALWLGGLAALARYLPWALRHAPREGRGRDSDLPLRLVGRFSGLAAFAVFVLAATGVFAALVQIPSLADLTGTAYGRALLVKLALLAPLLAVAAASNRLAAWRRPLPLSRLVLVEAGLGAALVLAVAVLVQAPTPRPLGTETAAPAAAQPVQRTWASDGLTAHLLASPAQTGPNTVQVHLVRDDGGPVGEVQQVRLRLTHPELGLATYDMQPSGGDLYTAQDVFLSRPGAWTAEVDVRRTGLDDVRASFPLPVAPAPAAPEGAAGLFANPLPRFNPAAVAGWALVVAGAAGLVWRGPLRRWLPAGHRWVPGGAAAVALAGVVLLVSAGHTHLAGTRAAPPQDPEAVARGRTLFMENCMRCHGATGKGDGPDAAGLRPPPADLTSHVPLHSDQDLFTFISKGIRGTAMPPFEGTLTEQERRDIVAFLRDEFGG